MRDVSHLLAPARRLVVSIAVAGAAALSSQALGAQPAACPRPAVAHTAAPARSLFAYDRREPLELRDSLARTVRGVAVRRVSFRSPKGGRATGWLYVPPDSLRGARERFAGVVVLHGAPGDAAGMEFVSEPLARTGAVVLAVDAPFARRDPGQPLAFTPRDSVDVVEYMVDLQRAVDVLVARPDVDASRLGAVGISFGGAMGALLAGVERRIGAYVLAVADGGAAEHYTDPTGARLPPPPGMDAAPWCRWYAAMEPLASTRFVGGAAPAHLLFLWGTRDPLVRPRLAHALWRAASAPKDSLWYDAGHALPMASGDDHRRWLAERIGLVPPPVFRGAAADWVGTYAGWGAFRDPLELQVVTDDAGRLCLRGPFTGPDDPAGRLTYLGPSPAGERFRLDDKRLTFGRDPDGTPTLRLDAPIDEPKFSFVLRRVESGVERGAGSAAERP